MNHCLKLGSTNLIYDLKAWINRVDLWSWHLDQPSYITHLKITDKYKNISIQWGAENILSLPRSCSPPKQIWSCWSYLGKWHHLIKHPYTCTNSTDKYKKNIHRNRGRQILDMCKSFLVNSWFSRVYSVYIYQKDCWELLLTSSIYLYKTNAQMN